MAQSREEHIENCRARALVGMTTKCTACGSVSGKNSFVNWLKDAPVCPKATTKKAPKNAAKIVTTLWDTVKDEASKDRRKKTKMRYWMTQQTNGVSTV